MTTTNSQKRDSKDYITVTVPRKNYEIISAYLEELGGDYHTAHMGKFYDKAAMEKFDKLKKEKQKK